MQLDHLTIIAPDLAAGAAHVRDLLGVEMPVGGSHPQMGTHNLLLRLGDDVFLEVIAVDPAVAEPARRRWFGLDDAAAVRRDWHAGNRLRGWVARTGDIDAVLAAHGDILGQKAAVSRGDRHWLFGVPADGRLPLDGIAPSVIDWGVRGHPVEAMADLGLALAEVTIEHPDPAAVEAVHRRLDLRNPPRVRQGPRLRHRASVRTPIGMRELY